MEAVFWVLCRSSVSLSVEMILAWSVVIERIEAGFEEPGRMLSELRRGCGEVDGEWSSSTESLFC